jgi:hypothetical protein
MTTLKLTVDDQIASRAEQVAKERNTTLNQLVSEFLEQLRPTEQAQRNSSADRLATTFRDLSRPLGGKPYQNRDDLYDR